jgi:hypothetical protein
MYAGRDTHIHACHNKHKNVARNTDTHMCADRNTHVHARKNMHKNVARNTDTQIHTLSCIHIHRVVPKRIKYPNKYV